MSSRALKKLYFALLILRYGGAALFLRHLKCQIYDSAIFLGLEKDLNVECIPVPCQVDYSLHVASEEDVWEMQLRAKSEGGESVYELIGRKWYYDSGFRDCYIARVNGTNELCFVQFMMSLADYDSIDQSYKSILPRLKEDEVWLENSYTFKKYRGKKVMSSVLVDLEKIAQDRGFRRMVTYIREDNIASIKGCERAGFTIFEQIPETKLLFSTSRKYNS